MSIGWIIYLVGAGVTTAHVVLNDKETIRDFKSKLILKGEDIDNAFLLDASMAISYTICVVLWPITLAFNLLEKLVALIGRLTKPNSDE